MDGETFDAALADERKNIESAKADAARMNLDADFAGITAIIDRLAEAHKREVAELYAIIEKSKKDAETYRDERDGAMKHWREEKAKVSELRKRCDRWYKLGKPVEDQKREGFKWLRKVGQIKIDQKTGWLWFEELAQFKESGKCGGNCQLCYMLGKECEREKKAVPHKKTQDESVTEAKVYKKYKILDAKTLSEKRGKYFVLKIDAENYIERCAVLFALASYADYHRIRGNEKYAEEVRKYAK